MALSYAMRFRRSKEYIKRLIQSQEIDSNGIIEA